MFAYIQNMYPRVVIVSHRLSIYTAGLLSALDGINYKIPHLSYVSFP